MSDYIITAKAVEQWDVPHAILAGEIVRCRDCKWFMSERKSETRGCFEILHPAFCNKHITNTEPDGFCAWGERRTDDN